jgi:hypothetical protein
LVRVIHHRTRQAFPGERLWTAEQLATAATIRFLRVRNREGCDVYVQPYAGDQNAGYILVDLDHARPTTIASMRAHGHEPCVVLQTSPAHLQAWVRLSSSPLEPSLASAAGKLLAAAYGGDPASTDWRHLGRLSGFTNQKPARRTSDGHAPWVKLVSAQAVLAPQAEPLCNRPAPSLAAPGAHLPPHHNVPRLGPRHHGCVDSHGVLSGLYAAMAYPSTLSATGLERRRLLGRAALAAAGLGSRPGSGHPASRQPALSPPPR